MSDTPKIDLVLADLEKEVVKPEPFVVVLSKNKRITFKDLFDIRASERHEFFDLIEKAKAGEADDFELLKRMLSPEDYQTYVDEDLPVRTHSVLVKRVMAHYEQGIGTPGEGSGSAS